MNYLSFKEFVDKYALKNAATTNIKIQQILNQLHLPTKVYMRDDTFSTDSGIVNLHPTKGTHWVMFVDENYFDSYGCPPPKNVLNQINKGTYSEYQIQKNDSYCAAYCLYVLYLTQIIGFKKAVLNLYYQTLT